ncbi:CoA ester lyase [Ideonella sp.]|uniref:HpcH/HpaI aldolase/citrate lyase family protein n=1 Tax=Ideonella sp. TaxID=1929293 RepID=UPI002B463937|nr:CoA ester lyase [Ideonella sp.]HJV71203.1 CoA ester lyase [Ideonella sp.]
MNTPRSYLFVPGDRPERFDKALASDADVVVLDLEDAVAADRKQAAREAIQRWVPTCDAATRARIAVRVNEAAAPCFANDLAMLQQAPVGLVMLPKAEAAWQIGTVRHRLPAVEVLALVETARGVVAVHEVAAAPGMARLVFGTLDFALDLGIAPEPAGLAHAAACLALASRAAGLPAPVAGVTPEIGDDTRLLADWGWAWALGFGAKLCIHPRQIAPLHDAMRPSAVELDWAERVIAAAAAARGAAVQVDGRMVDKPVLQRALALRERATR